MAAHDSRIEGALAKRLYDKVDFGRRVRVLTSKSADDSPTYHAAVFVVCLRKHHDVLGHAATGKSIPSPQIESNLFPHVFHRAIKTAFGEGLV